MAAPADPLSCQSSLGGGVCRLAAGGAAVALVDMAAPGSVEGRPVGGRRTAHLAGRPRNGYLAPLAPPCRPRRLHYPR